MMLLDKFDALRTNNIAVYWAASRLDLADRFLENLDLPENVHIFSSDRVERKTHTRGDEPVATLIGRSWHPQRSLRAAEFAHDDHGGFQLAALHGLMDFEQRPPPGIQYWALGGTASAAEPFTGKDQVVHSPGQPQGFCPQHVGPHGCTLVSVDGEGEIRTRTMETDVVRWHVERLDISEPDVLRDVRQAIRRQIGKLSTTHGRPLLISWTVTGEERFDSPFVRSKERESLLNWMRNEFGHGTPAIWSLSVDLEPPATIPAEWCDDDSILGDFLSAIRTRLESDQEHEGLQKEIPSLRLPAEILETLAAKEPTVWEASLREAAVLGADLLRGDEKSNRHNTLYSPRSEVEGVTT
jgi:hypothetical protein